MALNVNLKHFFDDEGNVSTLTDQANTVLTFLSKIVSSVSKNIEQPLIYVDVNCNARGARLLCEGSVEAKSVSAIIIEWHCDTCEASGTISNWQGSLWDKREHTIH